MTNGVLKRLPRHERPHKLDVIGAVLMVGATVALLLALSWGGGVYAWGSVEIIGLLGASAAAWILFVLRLLTAAEPVRAARRHVQPGGRGGHGLQLLRHGHVGGAVDLRADLFRGGDRPHGVAVRAGC